MVIYTMKDPSQQYAIGKDTPLVWASFITLLVSLTVTLVWVPFEGACLPASRMCGARTWRRAARVQPMCCLV